MNSEVVWKGAILATANAIQLYKSARTIGDDQSFGVATSLMILSSEEAIKALSYGFAAISNEEIDLNDLERELRAHSSKHALGGFYGSLVTVLPELIKKSDELERNDDVPDFLKRLRMKTFAKSMMDKSFNTNFESWLKAANSYKNAGLYVNYVDDKWVSPKDITKAEYATHKETCEYFTGLAYEVIGKGDFHGLVAIRKSIWP